MRMLICAVGLATLLLECQTTSRTGLTKNGPNTTEVGAQKIKARCGGDRGRRRRQPLEPEKRKSLSNLSRPRFRKLGHGICPFGKRRQIRAVQCRCGGRSVHGDEVPETNHRYIGLGQFIADHPGPFTIPSRASTPSFVCSYMRSTQGRYTISGGRLALTPSS